MKSVTHASETHRQNGFTLVEIAIVLAILGFLTAGILGGLGAFRDSADFKQDERQLKDIKEALLSFVAVNGYLPCPDTDTDTDVSDGFDGREDRNGNACEATRGQLPFSDLGTHSKNPWGKPYLYRVNSLSDGNQAGDSGKSASYFGKDNCSDDTTENGAKPPCFNIQTPPKADDPGSGNYLVEGSGSYIMGMEFPPDSSSWVGTAPLIVLSMGSNPIEDSDDCSQLSEDEEKNCDAFYQPDSSEPSEPFIVGKQSRQDNDFFDDALIWLTALEIKRFTKMLGNVEVGDEEPTIIPSEYSDEDEPFQSCFNDCINQGGSVSYCSDACSALLEDPTDPTDPTGDFSDHPFEKLTEEQLSNPDHTGNYSADGFVQDNLVADLKNLVGSGQNTLQLGEGNVVYIGNKQNTSIGITQNDNHVELQNDLKNPLDVSGSSNTVRIEGDVRAQISLPGSDNKVFVGKDVTNLIRSFGNDNEVYLETEKLTVWNSWRFEGVKVYEKDGDDWNCVKNCDD